jgi:serine/threonine protein kinase
MEIASLPAFADYAIEEIGVGELTAVFQARREDDGKQLVIKVVKPEFTADRSFVRRFIEAAGRSIRLDHPNIARVYEADEQEGIVYIVREFLESETLAEKLEREGPMTPEQAVPIVRQLASAMDYAHSRRLMHGDINDHCVFVSTDGHVTLADFGLAQAVASSNLAKRFPGKVRMVFGVGDPGYLAPERVQGQGPTRPSDIYALGILAYQLLAGHVPFSGNLQEVLEAQVYQPSAALHSINSAVPPSLSAAVARAISKRSELRYNTAKEFARAFEAAAEGIAPTHSPMISARSDTMKVKRQPVYWAVIIAVIAGLLLAVLLWNLVGWSERQLSNLIESGPSLPPTVSTSLPPTPAPASLTAPAAAGATGEVLPSPIISPTPLPSPTATPETPTPTPTLIATAQPPVVSEGSPFTNLVLAGGISEDNKPVSPGNTFPTQERPVYLFFDYNNVQAGTNWEHVWLRGDQELNRTQGTWPAEWGAAGSAWIFYTPDSSYQTGLYEVKLLIDDQEVASASFVVQ